MIMLLGPNTARAPGALKANKTFGAWKKSPKNWFKCTICLHKKFWHKKHSESLLHVLERAIGNCWVLSFQHHIASKERRSSDHANSSTHKYPKSYFLSSRGKIHFPCFHRLFADSRRLQDKCPNILHQVWVKAMIQSEHYVTQPPHNPLGKQLTL